MPRSGRVRGRHARGRRVGGGDTARTHFIDSDDYSGTASRGWSFDDLYEGHLDVRGTTTYDAILGLPFESEQPAYAPIDESIRPIPSRATRSQSS